MTLLIDVGNSAVKWAEMQSNGELVHHGQQVHRGVGDVSSLLVEHWRDVQPGTQVMGCNVASMSIASAVEGAANTLRLPRA